MSSPQYLLDTNMVSYSVKGTYPGVRARLLQVPADQLAISVITEAELCFRVANRPNETRVKILVDSLLGRIALDAILVTHDQAFNHIAELRTEDWVQV